MTTELVTVEKRITRVKEEINLSERMVETVLEKDIDWGLHPGTTSHALKDPGASKLINAFGCYSDPEILYREVSPQKISFVMKVKLIERSTNEVKATGVGSCTTTETKYGYRWVPDPEFYGYVKEELRKQQRDGKTLYRIPNPEREELENTILKMATKRAEVDAAQSLPGAGTALARMFAQAGGQPRQNDQWTAFWSRAKAMGLEREQVHKILGVTTMKDWTDSGKTLADAISTLSEKLADAQEQLGLDE